ncbi:uncharacterized protein DS421_15g511550 [Arachis hypogaea]|nr:uncharacterized protein DS421_15g511550 [Arachis hypogaea]
MSTAASTCTKPQPQTGALIVVQRYCMSEFERRCDGGATTIVHPRVHHSNLRGHLVSSRVRLLCSHEVATSFGGFGMLWPTVLRFSCTCVVMWLYHQMCRATDYRQRNLDGCEGLLLSWRYHHIPGC